MFECPVPESVSDRIQMAHGGGGRLMNDLIRSVFLEAFGSPSGSVQNDSAVLPFPAGRLAVTTDSFVVQPLEFPGGNIGSLAVHGTVNDLAMSGAEPLYLTAGVILEEGLSLDVLNRVVRSMAEAARLAGVRIVTGDTKVVERGKGDGIYINTAGVGAVPHDLEISPASVRPGDVVLLSGDLGRHGKEMLEYLLSKEGITLPKYYMDCGASYFTPEQKTFQGGSGAGCVNTVFNSYILKKMQKGELKRVLVVPTGALLNKDTPLQKETIPGISHAFTLESHPFLT